MNELSQRPPYPIYPEMNNGIIRLQEIQLKDLGALIEISFYDGKAAENLEDASAMHLKIQSDYQQGNSVHWGIFDLQKQKMVGTCGYYRGFQNGIGELGCVLKSEFRGQGYMTQALKLAIQFGLEQMELSKIIAITDLQNIPARRLLTRLEFVESGKIDSKQIEYILQEAAKNPIHLSTSPF